MSAVSGSVSRGEDPVSSGAFDGPVHVFPVRVYFEDTDAGGIVYHANYLKFAERARSELLRLIGLDHTGLMRGDEAFFFAVRRIAMEFRRPARLDDVLEISTSIVHVGGASMDLAQTIRRGGDGQELVRLTVGVACMAIGGGPTRMPASVRDKLQDFVIEKKRD